jgi:hypothetical protein
MATHQQVVSTNGQYRATLTVWCHNLLITKSAGAKLSVDQKIQFRFWWGTWSRWSNIPADLQLNAAFRVKSDAGNRSVVPRSDKGIKTVIDLRYEAFGPGTSSMGPFRNVESVSATGSADLAGEIVQLGPVDTAPA